MSNMNKLRAALFAVIAIEVAFCYINGLNVLISFAIVTSTFIAISFIFVPKASWLDSEAKVESMRSSMPYILSALSAVQKNEGNNLDSQDHDLHDKTAVGQRFKKIAVDKGLNLDIFTDAEIELIYQSVRSRFSAASSIRAEQIPEGVINYIAFHMFVMGADVGKQFIESHLDYEVSKYQESGIRPTYNQELNLATGQFSPWGITAKPKRPEISKAASAIINTVPSLLKMEMAVGMASVDIFHEDNYALGYVFGFIEGTMQAMNIVMGGNEYIVVYMMCYDEIFASPHGPTLLKRSFDIQDDELFSKGRNLGGAEAFEFKNQSLPPLGFSTHLLKIDMTELKAN